MASSREQLGHQLTPTIKLLRLLGKGAMGSVWRAEHRDRGLVAVKLLAPDYRDEPGFLARFRLEARAAEKLRSQHVVQIYEHGVSEEGQPYIVMELLEGETLRSLMQRLGPLPLDQVARIVSQIAAALSVAQTMGIVHRDIKPDNVFVLEREGEPLAKVIDFGVAKQTPPDGMALTTPSGTLGTPLYMSPEHFISAKDVDYRTDLWSLGVVAYQALTGRLPFTGETVGAVALAVHAGQFTPPCAVRRGLPAEVDAWMAQALRVEPSGRFFSARHMAAALDDIPGARRGATTKSTNPPPGQPSSRNQAREPPKDRTSTPPPVAVISQRDPEPESGFRVFSGAIKVVLMDPNFSTWPSGIEAIVCPYTNRNPTPLGDQILKMAGVDAVTGASFKGWRGTAYLTASAYYPGRRVVHFRVGSRAEWEALDDSVDWAYAAYRACLQNAGFNRIRGLAIPPLVGSHNVNSAIKAAVEHLSMFTSVEVIAFLTSWPLEHEWLTGRLRNKEYR